MSDELPVGTVCPFAGQVDPVDGKQNPIWGGLPCAGSSKTPGASAKAPMNHVEAEGWMLCDGRFLEVSAFPELFAAIGTLYGEETGTGHMFRIPDYRGVFLRGFDAGSGMDPDASTRKDPTNNHDANTVGSLQCDALQEHTHSYDVVQVSGTSAQGGAAGVSSTAKPTSKPESPARLSTETRPKNIAVNYIIKFR